ncbi:uncharacterized protein LOC111366617 [Olea europaea var. sylvestris]|uniref:uncharacterized protein LOC111366617 n=1 Tax=Olea europaea var. sylvestris TaxID=158386 RepID=UPI000C1D213A|nr:uncharacterized protein LOC111366617 [Olea europaea var. sylvestris]
MALLSLSFSLTTSTPIRKTSLLVSSPNPTSTTSSTWTTSLNTHALLPPFRRARALNLTRGGSRSLVVCMAPEEERMTRRSPLDFPIEWERPKPGRRPDIFPQFSPMKTPLPPPLPADPPEEDEEEEEEKKEEEEENPETEEPEKPDK